MNATFTLEIILFILSCWKNSNQKKMTWTNFTDINLTDVKETALIFEKEKKTW